jgi:hypothetical protein
MNWKRVRQLLELDDELDTFQLLREYIPSERQYLIDRRCHLVTAIRKDWNAEEDAQLDQLELFSDERELRYPDRIHRQAVRRS